jgi:hypothetical protein
MGTLTIANGELWLHTDSAPPRRIESPFAALPTSRRRRGPAWR